MFEIDDIIGFVVVLIVLIIIGAVIFDFHFWATHECVKTQQYCYNTYIVPIMVGKIMTTQIHHNKVDCDLSHDGVDEECVEWKSKE